jgi:hypothetical protein
MHCREPQTTQAVAAGQGGGAGAGALKLVKDEMSAMTIATWKGLSRSVDFRRNELLERLVAS